MQDCMEVGYSNLPTSGYRAVMRAPRNRPLQVFPKALLNRDMGYHEPGSLSPFNTFDSTGNLEATPPVSNKAGKKFPFGRIYFGGVGRGTQEIDPETREFLQKQIVQAPISIDTSWLTVGHVDEILSFVPAGGSKGFKMLIASPRLA